MIRTLIQSFLQWCYYSSDYAFVRDSKFAIPLLQSVHLIGIMMILGTTLVLNLRLLDLGFRRFGLPPLAEQLWPWAKTGIALAIGSGILVFLADPTRYANSGPFRLKMLLLFLAIVYQTTVFRRIVRKDPESRPQLLNAAVSAISLVLWFGVGWSGRAIAFFQ